MLSPETENIIQNSFQEAHLRGHELTTVEHLVFCLLFDEDIKDLLSICNVNIKNIQSDLENYFKTEYQSISPTAPQLTVEASLGFHRVIQRATIQVQASGKKEVFPAHILVSIFEEKESPSVFFLKQAGLNQLKLMVSIGDEEESEIDFGSDFGEDEDNLDPRDVLSSFTINLTEKAQNQELDTLIGRETELDRLLHVLLRRRKNNPLLVGEAGVGKTAIAEGLAQKIISGKVPEVLRQSSIYALDMGSLLAGTRYRGDFEGRFKAIMKALENKPGSILLIDEIHGVIGAGSSSTGGPDASNLLKPILSGGSIRCIGTTTYKEYRTYFEKDRALTRRFQKIDIEEPNQEDCLKILKGLKNKYEEFHKVKFSPEALQSAVSLSVRYLQDRKLPDKAIDLIDETGAGLQLKNKKNATITEHDIEQTVARIAQIPPKQISQDDKTALLGLEDQLKEIIFGQDAAIIELVAAIQLSRAGLRDPEKPIGSFLFMGPSGVGKTEIAKQLAKILGIAFVRFDMSEYLERHAVSRLIGAPPGYVGFEQGGLLTDAIHKTPHAVLLLDEIEKAHHDVFNMLLQIMDYGKLTDSNGRSTDFRHVIIIMTSNIGAYELAQARIGFGDNHNLGADDKAFKKLFSPEFRNRLDAKISFSALKPESMNRIVDKFLKDLENQLSDQKITLKVTDAVKKYLAIKGYDKSLGARPLARLIQDELKKPLAEIILKNQKSKLSKLQADIKEDKLAIV